MWIKRVRLNDYASFQDSGWISFGPSFNIILGANNSGKSAILKSLGNSLEHTPHRNEERFRAHDLPLPSQEIEIEVSGQEYHAAFLTRGGQIEWPTEMSPASIDSYRGYLSRTTTWALSRRSNTGFVSSRKPSHGLHSIDTPYNVKLVAKEGEVGFVSSQSNGADGAARPIVESWPSWVFFFDPQRFHSGRAPFSAPDRLDSNAANLPSFLNKLQGDRPDVFRKLVEHMREIIPTVGNLSVTALASNEFEVRVWQTVEQLRPELSFSLKDCGTGIAQVISILSVVMTLDQAIVIIDEIGTFLHPAATKALIRTLVTYYSRHQYIISTHSLDALAASVPDTIHLVSKAGFRSSISQIDLKEVEDIRSVSSHLGVSMADILSADKIIWVEGPTEELCFSFLYREKASALPRDTRFIPVVATGDLVGSKQKRRDLVFEIYDRLSRAATDLVRSVVFSFDSEDLDATQKAGLRKRSAGRIFFLPRRHLECYLIEPTAVARLIRDSVPDIEHIKLVGDIEEAILSAGGDPMFRAKAHWRGDYRDREWLVHVDAARLLKRVCTQITGGRFEFGKVTHSLELLRHIVADDPARVEELRRYVLNLITSVK